MQSQRERFARVSHEGHQEALFHCPVTGLAY